MTEPTRHSGQDLSHEQAVQKLESACRANDVERVRELFQTTPLAAADATDRLDSLDDESPRLPYISLMRCLLENGADTNDLYFDCVERDRVLDVMKMFAEHGYDVKAKGHSILQ